MTDREREQERRAEMCEWPQCGYGPDTQWPPHGGCSSDIHEWMIHHPRRWPINGQFSGFCLEVDCHPYTNGDEATARMWAEFKESERRHLTRMTK
jgi:hypothetical protein